MSHPQEPRTRSTSTNRDKRRDLKLFSLTSQFITDHRPERRMHDCWGRYISRMHVITTTTVIRFTGTHGPDHRQVIHDLGRLRHVLTDLQITLGADRLEFSPILRFGFQVPNIDRRRTPAHPHQDTRLLTSLQIRSVGFDMRDEIQGRNRRCGGRHVSEKMSSRHAGWCDKIHGLAP